MSIKEVQELIKLIDKSDLAEFQFKDKDVEVRIRSNKFYESKGIVHSVPAAAPMAYPPMTAPAPSAPVAATSGEDAASAKKDSKQEGDKKLLEIKSPMVGTFYRSSAPDKPSFVSVGDSVSSGSVVCIIEAMKLFNEIESEISGKIVKVMVEDATPVEYDQVLFLVEP